MIQPRIEIYDSFFDDEFLKELTCYVNALSWKPEHHSNKAYPYTFWNCDFTHTGSQNRDDAYEKLKADELRRAWDAVQVKAIRASHKLLRCYANRMEFGDEGYPHRDTDKEHKDDLTCVAYFCGDDWKVEHGGETALIIGDEIIKSVVPRVNRLLLFPSSMTHVARGVTRACLKPRVTLMWKSCPAS